MNTMYIGSGDVKALLMGRKTAGHQALLQRFVSGIKPHYNALNSPIDALRTGAILESKFAEILEDDYYPQCVVQSSEMDVFKCSLDFAKLSDGKVVNFKELKTMGFVDFMEVEALRGLSDEAKLKYLIKTHESYYNQVQEQLYCTELNIATLVFLVVYSYDDSENYNRTIHENEYVEILVPRDEAVISKIKGAGEIFQQIKNYYK